MCTFLEYARSLPYQCAWSWFAASKPLLSHDSYFTLDTLSHKSSSVFHPVYAIKTEKYGFYDFEI